MGRRCEAVCLVGIWLDGVEDSDLQGEGFFGALFGHHTIIKKSSSSTDPW